MVCFVFFLNFLVTVRMSCRPPRKRHCRENIKEQIFLQLRQVQQITGCSTKTLDVVLERLHPFLKGLEDVAHLKMPRMRARKKTDFKKQLHGCVGCHDYVFGPDNCETLCPKCGSDRYTLDGKPREVRLFFYHFFFTYLLTCLCRCAGSSPCGINCDICFKSVIIATC